MITPCLPILWWVMNGVTVDGVRRAEHTQNETNPFHFSPQWSVSMPHLGYSNQTLHAQQRRESAAPLTCLLGDVWITLPDIMFGFFSCSSGVKGRSGQQIGDSGELSCLWGQGVRISLWAAHLRKLQGWRVWRVSLKTLCNAVLQGNCWCCSSGFLQAFGAE